MGWNDRLPEDPYTPFESEDDRRSYEEWLHYVESHLRYPEESGGLTSANIELQEFPTTEPTPEDEREAILQRFVDRFCGKKAEAAPESGLAPNQQCD